MATIDKNYLSRGGLSPARSQALSAPLVSDPLGRAGAGVFSAGRARSTFIRPEFQDPLIDKVGPVVSGDKMANMFGQFANASLKIADKSNELLARQQLINVKDELRELGYNADSGYFLTRGQQTLDRRKEVQDRAEDIIRKGLMGVNANARQKLFPSLMAEREAFLNNMSQYASAQHKVWEEDVKKRELQDLAQTIPEFNHDPVLYENTVNATLAKIFPPGNPAYDVARQKAYEKLAEVSISSLMYSPYGIAGAIKRYAELEDKLGIETRLRIRKELETGISTFNSRERQRTADEEKERSRRKVINAERLYGSFVAGENISQEQIALLLTTNQLTVSAARALRADIEKPVVTDPIVYSIHRRNLLENANSPFGDEARLDLLASSEISSRDKIQLLKDADAVNKSAKKDLVKRHLGRIENMVRGPDYNIFNKKREIETRVSAVQEEYMSRYLSGEDPSKIFQNMQSRYEPAMLFYGNLPELPNGGKPTTYEELDLLAKSIQFRFREGDMSNTQKNHWTEVLMMYKKFFDKHGEFKDKPVGTPDAQ